MDKELMEACREALAKSYERHDDVPPYCVLCAPHLHHPGCLISRLDREIAAGDEWREIGTVPDNETVLLLLEADKSGPPSQGLIQTGQHVRCANGHVWIIANMHALHIGGKPIKWRPLYGATPPAAEADTTQSDEGWLRKELDAAKAEVAKWPDGMARRAEANTAEKVIEAARRLSNEVRGCWEMSESSLRYGIGNTNYAIVRERLLDFAAALAAHEGRGG